MEGFDVGLGRSLFVLKLGDTTNKGLVLFRSDFEIRCDRLVVAFVHSRIVSRHLVDIAQSPSKLLNKSDQNVTILYTRTVYRRARVYVRRVNSN